MEPWHFVPGGSGQRVPFMHFYIHPLWQSQRSLTTRLLVMDLLPEDIEIKDLVRIMLQMSFWPGLIESFFSARRESRKNPISVLERV